jgi:hypothetical protein
MFDYLGVLISVILGLALTHILTGWARQIELRRQVRLYWVQVVWSVGIVVYVLALWWGMFWWRHLTVWPVELFFFLAAYTIALFMLATILSPTRTPEGMDFEAHFFANRRWFFGVFLLCLLFDIPETLAKGVEHLRDVPVLYRIFMPVWLVIAVSGLVTANRRVHAVLAPAYLASLLGYLVISSLERIIAR